MAVGMGSVAFGHAGHRHARAVRTRPLWPAAVTCQKHLATCLISSKLKRLAEIKASRHSVKPTHVLGYRVLSDIRACRWAAGTTVRKHK